jgi:hypothetical protein
VILLPLLLALAPAAGNEVLARVDGVEITRAAYEARLAVFRAQNLQPKPSELIDNLVAEALLAAEAERAGLRKDPAIAAALEREHRRVVADVFLTTELAATAAPPETMLRQLFHATGDFARYQLLAYQTREEADAAAARLRKGATPQAEAPKALTARVTPTDAAAPLVMRAQMEPATAEAVFATKAGAIAGPFPFSEGFAVAKIVEVIVGDEATFQARRAGIADHARGQLAAQAKSHYLQQLRARAGAKLDEDFLSKLKGIDPTPEEAAHVIATLDGVPLRYADILEQVRELARSTGGHGMGAAVKLRVATQEIDTRLAFQAARARGYESRPEAVAATRTAARNVLATAMVAQIRRTTPPPTEQELRAFHERNLKAYGGRKLDEVRPDVVARTVLEKQDLATSGRIEALRKKADVRIDDAAVARAAKGAA